MQLSNRVSTLWSIMAIVHLKDWIIHMVSERNWLPPPIPKSKWQWSEGCNRTAPLNQDPRFASTMPWHRLSPLTNVIWRVIVCAPRQRQQHSAVTQCVKRWRRRLQLSQSRLRRREEASLSLLTSSVCLAARLIAGVCPAKGGAAGHAAKRNLAPASRKQTCILGINTHPAANVASL